MNKLYVLLFLIPITILGCKSLENDSQIINQSINTLNMNIFSNEGKKLLSIKSPYSNYDKDKNIFNLKETKIYLFKDNKSKYIITSEISKLSNNNKLLELKGDVIIKTHIKEEGKIHTNSFIWNIENSEFLLLGNVKFENNLIFLSSNKAILDTTNNIIEFFKPVNYKVYNSNNESGYEVNSENAYYNLDTKSVNFRSTEERVRTKIYF